jgi:protein gp37
MADRSRIEWTGATWNPVTGCDRISAGCDNCYALSLAKRLKSMGVDKYQTDGDCRTSGPGFAVTTHHDALDQPRRWQAPRTVFVNSMSDLFHAKVPLEFIQEVFQVMVETPHHTYQILTKRPLRASRLASHLPWPTNVWFGVSVENMTVAHRVDHLRRIPAAVRFLSCEPLLGSLEGLDLTGVDWVIAGGESGRGYRPMDIRWAQSLRDLCVRGQIPFFFKQWAGRTPRILGRELDGEVWNQMPEPLAQ